MEWDGGFSGKGGGNVGGMGVLSNLSGKRQVPEAQLPQGKQIQEQFYRVELN